MFCNISGITPCEAGKKHLYCRQNSNTERVFCMEENKELVELLQKIEKTNQQQVRLTRLVCVFALIAAVFCGCTFALVYALLPQITDILPQISTVATQMQAVLTDLEQATAQLAEMDFSGMVENVDTLVVTAQDSLAQTMEKFNAIDLETLNQAIEDLAQVVEPMSKLMSMFG